MNPTNRFSVLNPESGLDSNRASKKREKKSNKENGVIAFKDPPKKSHQLAAATGQNKSKKKNHQKADLQALAFGFSKGKGGSKKAVIKDQSQLPEKNEKTSSKKTKKATNQPQFNGSVRPDDEWKKKDEEFVKCQNEKTLKEAIMLSKLDFEEKKTKQNAPKPKVNKVVPPSPPEKKEPKQIKKKKKDKPLTISLGQFNTLQPKQIADLRNPKPEPAKNTPQPPQQTPRPPKPAKEKFFQDVDEATKTTIDKEEYRENSKALANLINQDLMIKKLKCEIEKRDFEIQALRLEEESLRDELKAVKSRNKKLCDVISASELRSKGELVIELEKVSKTRDEFSSEVATISGELEQEKTKVSTLTQELKKLQGRRRNADFSK